MMTSQDVLGWEVEAITRAAILDRLMHNAVVFNIKGPSWRLREQQSLTTATTDPDRSRH